MTNRQQLLLVTGSLVAFSFVSWESGHLAAERSSDQLRAYADRQAYDVCTDRRARTMGANRAREAERRNWLIAAAAREADHDLGVAEAYRQNAATLTPSPLPECGPRP